jgi:hypothetical protein
MPVVLIARTPRAGEHNHIDLLPPGELPAGFSASSYLDAAGHAAVGGDYLAVSREVPQQSGRRGGREVLVLTGVKVPPAGPERERLQERLNRKLDQLAVWVDGQDWAKFSGVGLTLPDLAEWAREFDTPPAETRRPKRWLVAYAAVLVVLVVGFAATGQIPERWLPSWLARKAEDTPPTTTSPSPDKLDQSWADFDKVFRRRDESLGESYVRLKTALAEDGFEGRGVTADKGDANRPILLTHEPFKEWLLTNYGDEGPTAPDDQRKSSRRFQPFLNSTRGDDEAKRLQDFYGPFNGAADLEAARRHVAELNRLLHDLAKISADGPKQFRERFPLTRSLDTLRAGLAQSGRKATAKPPGNGPAEVSTLPFVTEAEAGHWLRAAALVSDIGTPVLERFALPTATPTLFTRQATQFTLPHEAGLREDKAALRGKPREDDDDQALADELKQAKAVIARMRQFTDVKKVSGTPLKAATPTTDKKRGP